MFAGDVPDQTVPELRENDEDDEHSLSDEDYEEIQADFEDLKMMAWYTFMASTIGEMLMDGQLTFKEYIEYVEWVEDMADEKGVHLP